MAGGGKSLVECSSTKTEADNVATEGYLENRRLENIPQ